LIFKKIPQKIPAVKNYFSLVFIEFFAGKKLNDFKDLTKRPSGAKQCEKVENSS
jgi:hypothetical protein